MIATELLEKAQVNGDYVNAVFTAAWRQSGGTDGLVEHLVTEAVTESN